MGLPTVCTKEPNATLLGPVPPNTSSVLRTWGLRSVASLVDQSFTSIATFAMTVLLARWLTPADFGAFAVAFAVFLLVSGFYNALLLEPLSVIGPARHAANLEVYFQAQIAVHFAVVGSLSMIVILVGGALRYFLPANPLGASVIGGGLALPFLLLLWLTRRMCYIIYRQRIAVYASTFNLLFVVGGLLLAKKTGFLTPFLAFMIAGSGSLLASVALVALIRSGFTRSGGQLSSRQIFLENWAYGKWITGSALLNSLTTHFQTVLVSMYLGLYAAGIFRAMQIPMLGLTQVLAAAGPLILPAFSRDFGQSRIPELRRKAILTSASLGTLTFMLVAMLALVAGPLEKLLFRGSYSPYASLMPVLGLVPACMASCMGCAMAMRAVQRPQFDLAANAISGPTSLICAIFLLPKFGLKGAAVGMVIGSAVYMACTIVAFRRSASFSRGHSS